MSRPEGLKNRSTITKTDNEDTFLAEVLEGHTRWKAEAAKRKEAGLPNQRELDYAEAYRVLLHKFSYLETPGNE